MNKFDEKIFVMAKREQMPMREEFIKGTDDILYRLPRKGNSGKITVKAAVILAAILILTTSTTVFAVNLYEQRMKAMNHEKMEQYFAQVQTAVSADNTNRSYSNQEKTRMEELNKNYEQEGTFPDGELRMIDNPEEYSGKGVAFFPHSNTFFLPKEEMSDEELLQIIDFRHQRDYSLAQINTMIEEGKAEYDDIVKIDSTEENIIIPSNENLVIPYKGQIELKKIAASEDCLYLAGTDSIEKMQIGQDISTPFFDEFGNETVVVDYMTVAEDDTLYVALRRYVSENREEYLVEIWHINENGELLSTINVSDKKVITRMVVDLQNNIYLRCGLFESPNDILMILDKEGKEIGKITSEKYTVHPFHGMCIGKDGEIYILLYDEDDDYTDVALIDAENQTIKQVYEKILPGDVAAFDMIMPGVETDFIIWGYEGIYTYNLGDEQALSCVKAYESPCQWEGCKAAILKDGRMVFAAADAVNKVETFLGTEYRWKPESTVFYYVPTIKY